MGAVGLANLSSSNTTPPPTTESQLTPVPSPNSMVFSGPLPVIDATKPHVATLQTNQGEIDIQLATDAPQTVNSFAFLAGKHFFDGQEFFYVNPALGAVAGDPTCTTDTQHVCSGVGNPGYTLPLEKTTEVHDQWAVVAPFVTEGGQDVHGSQFRILFQPDSRLDGKETVFGKVVKGQQILQALSACSIVEGQPCNPPLVIQQVIVKAA